MPGHDTLLIYGIAEIESHGNAVLFRERLADGRHQFLLQAHDGEFLRRVQAEDILPEVLSNFPEFESLGFISLRDGAIDESPCQSQLSAVHLETQLLDLGLACVGMFQRGDDAGLFLNGFLELRPAMSRDGSRQLFAHLLQTFLAFGRQKFALVALNRNNLPDGVGQLRKLGSCHGRPWGVRRHDFRIKKELKPVFLQFLLPLVEVLDGILLSGGQRRAEIVTGRQSEEECFGTFRGAPGAIETLNLTLQPVPCLRQFAGLTCEL